MIQPFNLTRLQIGSDLFDRSSILSLVSTLLTMIMSAAMHSLAW